VVPGGAPLALVRLVAGLGVAAVGGWMLRLGAHDATLVRWDCAAATCATDDFAGGAIPLGAMVLVVAAALVLPLLREATAGMLLTVAAGALLSGWTGAVADGLTPSGSLRWQIGIAVLLLAVGVVAGVVGAVRVLRCSGVTARLSGLTGTWARVRDYENIDGTRCRATVHFDDARGVRHTIGTEVPRDAFRRPPRVFYDPLRPDDADRIRVVVPSPPLVASARQVREQAVRALLPFPDEDLDAGSPRAPGSAASPGSASRAARTRFSTTSTSTSSSTRTSVPVVEALERLHALHAAGALSDEEYAAAKSGVLGTTGRRPAAR
jgi:hypothetical protein